MRECSGLKRAPSGRSFARRCQFQGGCERGRTGLRIARRAPESSSGSQSSRPCFRALERPFRSLSRWEGEGVAPRRFRRLPGAGGLSQKIGARSRIFERSAEPWSAAWNLPEPPGTWQRAVEASEGSQSFGTSVRSFEPLSEASSETPKVPGFHRIFQHAPEPSTELPILLHAAGILCGAPQASRGLSNLSQGTRTFEEAPFSSMPLQKILRALGIFGDAFESSGSGPTSRQGRELLQVLEIFQVSARLFGCPSWLS